MSELNKNFPIGSLLSARQFLEPKIYEDTIFFISNLIGHYSLYEMKKEGSLPVPMIPETIALQNPHIMHTSASYEIFPKLNKLIVMIDENGNELYQPFLVSMYTGGVPSPLFEDKYKNFQVNLQEVDHENNFAFFNIDDRINPGYELILANIETGEIISFGRTPSGLFVIGFSAYYNKILVSENYGLADEVLYLITNRKERSLLLGLPPDDRTADYKKISFKNTFFIEEDNAIIGMSHMLTDTYGILRFDVKNPREISDVPIKGLLHTGIGEFNSLDHVKGNIFLLSYNIDGVSYIYVGEYVSENEKHVIQILRNLVGFDIPLTNGVSLGISYDKIKMIDSHRKIPDEFVLSLTKALMPSQIFLIDTTNIKNLITQMTSERVLGIPKEYLSEGESANFKSFDEFKISARLYRPAEKLGFEGPRPLVIYIHGGPTVQERPDFTSFSMPIIQYLTLHGFCVFVPNVRGSTGYGHDYMSRVYKDWGGGDYKDHIEGLKFLKNDPLIDSTKRFVFGRSYGGFMTLYLLSKNPVFWTAGCDMFGPYDLIGFYNRLPSSWKVGMKKMMGDPENEEDNKFLVERSPKTYLDQLKAPMLVIQGRNDPRILVQESEEIVQKLRKAGKEVEMVIYEDEGHDVIKIKNKIDCYEKITSFFLKYV
ncbi:MAG: Acylamino-acid-releasing enzyme [Candidatus Heimdallarchaeota archaeon LC_3]|nr:MAG: Acylamino-acid-releasing enzyme [Candidatus Heimdallarchaeota archaeon LC_3]